MEEIRKAFVIRHSAVVLYELRREARTRESQRLVHALHEAAWETWIAMARDSTGSLAPASSFTCRSCSSHP
jgi:hypothetical protein